MEVAVFLLSLVLPLIGGYAYARISVPSYFYVVRESKIHFRAIFYAVSIFCAAAYAHISFAVYCSWYGELFFSLLSGIAEEMTLEEATWYAASLWSIDMSLLFAYSTRFFWWLLPNNTKKKILLRIIDNPLESMITHAMSSVMPMMITLPTGKVYVGQPLKAHLFGNRKFIEILPLASGYRNRQRRFVETANYAHAYKAILQEKKKEHLGNLSVIIPTQDITSVHLYDPMIPVWHFSAHAADTTAERQPEFALG